MAIAYAEYAGVKLPLWTADCDAALARANLDLSRFQQFAADPDTASVEGLPLPPRLTPAEMRGGTLWWPTGASQWARAHFVVDTVKLAEIRAQLVTDAGGSTGGYVAADLVLSDGLGGGDLTTAMHLLPPLPLAGSEDAYLLTLVDERYYWWFKPLTYLSAAYSWTTVYAEIGTILGETITVDGSLSAFAPPTEKWLRLAGAATPLLLDSAAWCTGRRIVRELDGSVRATDYATAKSAAAAIRSGWGTTYRRRGGGVAPTTDLQKTAPALALVRTSADDYVLTDLATLAITDYGSVTGKPQYRVTLLTDADAPTTGQVEAFATAWYGWLLAAEDTSLAGIAAFDPNGWYGAVEWTLRRDECGTRVYPTPHGFGYTSGDFTADTVDCVDGASGLLWNDAELASGGAVASALLAAATLTVPPAASPYPYLFTYQTRFAVRTTAGGGAVSAWLAVGGGNALTTTFEVPAASKYYDAALNGSGILEVAAGSTVTLYVYFAPASGVTYDRATVFGQTGGTSHRSPSGSGVSGVSETNLAALRVCLPATQNITFYAPSPPTSPPPPPPIPPPPAGEASISGHVNSDWPDYDPVVGRTVTISGVNSGTTTTDADGWYEFTSLTAERARVSLSTTFPDEFIGYSLDGGGWIEGDSVLVDLTADTDHDLDFRLVDLTASTVSGTVTDVLGPTAVPDRVLTCVQGATTTTATTNGSGVYTFSSLRNAATTISLAYTDPPEFDPEYNLDSGGWTAGATVTFPVTGTHDLDFRVDGIVISPPVPPPPP